MGLAFAFVGLLLIVTGAQNTYADFGNAVKGDLTGQGNFTYWIAAILMIGVLGYIPALNKFSHWFLALILLSLFLSHKGFFSSFQAALAAGPTAPNVSGSASNAQPGTFTGTPIAGSGLTGNSTTTGENTTSTPTISNFWSWLHSPNMTGFYNPFVSGAK